MLDPAGELDVLIAHQRIAEKLNFRRRFACNQQDADLLTNDLDRGGCDVVFMRQLRPRVLHSRAKFILAHHSGRDAERRPFEDTIFSQDDALGAGRLPGPLVDALFQDDRCLGIAQAASLDLDGQHHGVTHEYDRADLDVSQANIPRTLVRPGGDGKDRYTLPRGPLDDAERIFASIGASVGRQDHTGNRLAAMRREDTVQRVAQRRDRGASPGYRRACGPAPSHPGRAGPRTPGRRRTIPGPVRAPPCSDSEPS